MTHCLFEKASIQYFQLTPKAIAPLDSTNPRAAVLLAALTLGYLKKAATCESGSLGAG